MSREPACSLSYRVRGVPARHGVDGAAVSPLGFLPIGVVIGFVAVWVLCAARQRADRERMREWREKRSVPPSSEIWDELTEGL